MRETDLYRKRSERSRVYLGKLREVSSSEYVMFDSGVNTRQDTLHPCDIRSSEESDEENEEEKEQVNSAEEDALYKSQLCSIFYHTKTRPTTGLGMEVCVPTIPSKTNPVQGDLRTDLVQCFKEIRADGRQNDLFAHKCFIMQEKKSKYDPLSSCLVDFQGRASTASVKNFQLLESTPFRLGERQLAAKAADDEVIFQLGKVSALCMYIVYCMLYRTFMRLFYTSRYDVLCCCYVAIELYSSIVLLCYCCCGDLVIVFLLIYNQPHSYRNTCTCFRYRRTVSTWTLCTL